MNGPDSLHPESSPAPTLDTDKVVVGPTLPETPTGSLQQSGANSRAAEVAIFVALGVLVLFFLLPFSSRNAVATAEEELDSGAGWLQAVSEWMKSDESSEEAAAVEATYAAAPAAEAPAFEEAPPAEAPADAASEGAGSAPAEAPADQAAGGGYYLEISNTTGRSIEAIYVNGASATDWGQNRLGNEVLPNGYKIRVDLGAQSSPVFDVRLVDVDGDSYTYSGVDVSKFDITAKSADVDPRGD